MTQEFKKLIENLIIKFQQTADGIIYTDTFVSYFKEDHKLRASITRIMINDLNLLERLGTHAYRITQKGWSFTSFADIEKLQSVKSERDEIDFELAKSNLAINKLNQEIAERNRKNESHNRIATWINVGIGLINIALLVFQILREK